MSLAIVEKRFKAADPNNEGTIDAKECRPSAAVGQNELIA